MVASSSRRALSVRSRVLPVRLRPAGRWRTASSARRLTTSLVVGLLVGVVATVLAPDQYGPMLGWDRAAATFLFGSWLEMWRLDGEATAGAATREGPSTRASDAVLLAAAVASLFSVGLVLFGAGRSTGVGEVLRGTSAAWYCAAARSPSRSGPSSCP